MAISRRAILKLGVSYGTGIINHGNDSIVYERELRKLASNPAFDDFESAMGRAAEAISSAAPEQLQTQTGSNEVDTSTVANAASLTLETPLPNTDSPVTSSPEKQSNEAERFTSKEAIGEEPTNAETPHENPLKDIIETAERFRELCSQLALSSLYLQMTSVINAMQEECLPAVDDLAKIKQDYNAILDYLKHC